MTILPKNFGGAKKSHRKPSSSQLPEHSGHSKGHGKRAAAERLERATPQHHLAVSKSQPIAQEEPLNSDDEYGSGFKDEELEAAFVENMKKVRGFDVKVVKGDGACMFRAVADQIYGDQDMHLDVRRLCMDYVAKNRDHFSQFITEDFNEYLERKKNVDVHGNHVELQAISEIFLRPIEIYEYDTKPINTFHPISREANNRQENPPPPIRLSYHGSIHYNSVVDPFTPTIGVGLGLPGYAPGQADQNLMKEAKLASERQHIEEAMLKDKLKMTDWERTEEELQRQVATESYLDYLRQIERQSEQKHSKNSSHDKASSYKQHHRVASPNHVSRSTVSKSKSAHHHYQQTGIRQHASDAVGPSKVTISGVKRGASSPNLPCDYSAFSVPLSKIHRNENASTSMPNIGESFGSSLNGPSSQLLKPSTSNTPQLEAATTNHPSTSFGESEEGLHQIKAGTSKESNDEQRPSIGLYEELLATTTAYGDWNETDDTTLLAQVIALSQQEFLDELKKSPHQ